MVWSQHGKSYPVVTTTPQWCGHQCHLWIHHTQLTEATEDNRWILIKSSDALKIRLVWALSLWLFYFVPLFPHGKGPEPL